MLSKQSTLREDIEAELEFEPSLDATHVGVTEKNGICTLTGHVDSYFEKWAAERAASRVKGVRAVAEQIEVHLPFSSRHGSDEIALRAANVISWNAMLPDDVVKVKVENGWVTLTGEVDWQYQKRAAEDGIRGLGGVAGITNMITIGHHVAASDVRERIASAYKRSAEFDASNITIAVNGGMVTLSGHVKAWNERQSAETAVWNIAGVTEVVDHLTIG
jgi:osmotically-inducible protein OsmY